SAQVGTTPPPPAPHRGGGVASGAAPPPPRHKIRHWLNTEQKQRSIDLGRKLVEKEAKRYKVAWLKLVAENALDGVLSEYGLARLDDLYADVGYGKVSARNIVERFISEEHKDAPPTDEGVLQKAVRKIFPFTG